MIHLFLYFPSHFPFLLPTTINFCIFTVTHRCPLELQNLQVLFPQSTSTESKIAVFSLTNTYKSVTFFSQNYNYCETVLEDYRGYSILGHVTKEKRTWQNICWWTPTFQIPCRILLFWPVLESVVLLFLLAILWGKLRN